MSDLRAAAEIGRQFTSQPKREKRKGVISVKDNSKRDRPPIWQRRSVHPAVKLGAVATAGTGVVLAASSFASGGGSADAEGVQISQVPSNPAHHIKTDSMPSLSDTRLITEPQKSVSREFSRITDKDIENALHMVPKNMRENARIAIPMIARALKDEGLDEKEVFAYALATAEHESFFDTIKEIEGETQAEKFDYDGGPEFMGRGYLMLTGKKNYEMVGKYLGIDLVNNPDLLLDPKISARVLAAFFKIVGTRQYARSGDFVNARKTISRAEFDMNDQPFKDAPWKIAARAYDYLGALE